jgi:hypothetical protein
MRLRHPLREEKRETIETVYAYRVLRREKGSPSSRKPETAFGVVSQPLDI